MSFAWTTDGKLGYKKDGADTVTPFNNSQIIYKVADTYGNVNFSSVASSIGVDKTKLTVSNFRAYFNNALQAHGYGTTTLGQANCNIAPNVSYTQNTGIAHGQIGYCEGYGYNNQCHVWTNTIYAAGFFFCPSGNWD